MSASSPPLPADSVPSSAAAAARARILAKRAELVKAAAISDYPIARVSASRPSPPLLSTAAVINARRSNNQPATRPSSLSSLPPTVTVRGGKRTSQLSSSSSSSSSSRLSSRDDSGGGWEDELDRLTHSQSRSVSSSARSSPSSPGGPARSQSQSQSQSVPVSPTATANKRSSSPPSDIEPGSEHDNSIESISEELDDYVEIEPGAPSLLPLAQPVSHALMNNNSDIESDSDYYNPSLSNPHRGRVSQAIGHATQSFAHELSSLEDHRAIKNIVEYCDRLPVIASLAVKLNVSSFYVTLTLALSLLLLSLNFIGVFQLVQSLILIYPCYQSYHALKIPDDDSDSGAASVSGSPRRWLQYWCCYGLFKCLTFLADYYIQSNAYHVAKILYLVFCFHPSTDGANLTCQYVLMPLYHANSDTIEHVIDAMLDTISGLLDECKLIVRSAVVSAIAGRNAHSQPSRLGLRKASVIRSGQ